MSQLNPARLAILTELRQAAGLTLTDMARRCGLHGRQSHQTAGAWERGVYVPTERRRLRMIGYLWDDLGLRTDPARFETIWMLLVDEWNWQPLSDQEWAQLSSRSRPSQTGEQDSADPVQAEAETSNESPFQAPAFTAHFVGRTEELAQVAAWLAEADSSTPGQTANQETPAWLALVGMGGAGKTTLAARTARQQRTAFPHGVLWAHTRVSEPSDILNSWARAFGHDYSSMADVESRAAAVRTLLAGKRCLLVLDDVTDAARVRPLLPAGSGCAVLLTTRNEDVAAALGCRVLRLHELSAQDALALLTEILGRDRIAAEEEAAAAICRQLHYLPLAVEIAGQLLAVRSHRSLASMARRLQEQEGRLDLKIADRAVRTSFLVSWASLERPLQQTFTRLAVFQARSFGTALPGAMLDLPISTVEEQLDTLAALSLVTPEGTQRYRQHPLLADFAREQLGDEPDVWARFAADQLTLARDHLDDPAWLENEWENLGAGLRTAHMQGDRTLVLAYADALGEPWRRHARYAQARQGYAWACHAAEAQADEATLAALLVRWGEICFEQDSFEEATDHFRQARTLCAAGDAGPVWAETHFWLGRMALERGEYERADRDLDVSQAAYLRLEDPVGLARVHYQQAQLAYDRGDLAETGRLADRAAALQEATGDRFNLAATLRLQADMAIEQADYAGAASLCRRALEICRALHSRAELAATYYSLAVVERLQARLPAAAQYAGEAEQLCRRLGMRAFGALVVYEQSRIVDLQDDPARAYDLGAQSVAHFRELGRTFNLVYALNHLGRVCFRLGNVGEGRIHWQDALALAEELDHPLAAEIRSQLAELLPPA